MKVFFYVNTAKDDADGTHRALSAALAGNGLCEAESAGDADVVVALGGDGTILDAVRFAPGKPVAGFNIGSLGYLASVERRDFGKALAMLAKGKYRISPRTVLECSRQDAPAAVPVRALNDVVLMRERSGHPATIDVAVDGRRAATYFADGLIVATPTGSTAYSLSAGGPVLMPDSASFVITPLNPHALAVRPIVVGDGVSISAVPRRRADGRGAAIAVYADGRDAMSLEPDSALCIRKSALCAQLVEFDGYDPYRVLSRKLGWPGKIQR